MAAVNSGQALPDEVKAIALLDENNQSLALGSLLEDRVAVLVFLRHFGCIACSEHVSEWKPRLREFDRIGARVIFIGNGEPKHLAGFINKVGLADEPASAYTEPSQKLHRAIGLVNSVGSTVGPGAVFNALRAFSRGHLQTSVEGDAMQQGGLLITQPGGVVAYIHRERQLGDYLDVSEVLERVISLIEIENEGLL